jgi:hypothetical protein
MRIHPVCMNIAVRMEIQCQPSQAILGDRLLAFAAPDRTAI